MDLQAAGLVGTAAHIATEGEGIVGNVFVSVYDEHVSSISGIVASYMPADKRIPILGMA